ncbi:MAG TPA: cytochrome c biogenesis protein DipZ [Gemmatimonadales bacterium]|nr:cytochrome c biogenesis protein DipZ [Gemmatimonadales bacterium]
MTTLLLVSYLGGVLTIVSPCILPVLPFVFARADQPFTRSGLPLLAGMAVAFAGVASLAAVGGGWVVHANQFGRFVALVLLAFFGLTLLSDSLTTRLTRPLVSLGARLSQSSDQAGGTAGGVWPSFLLGIATGLLWAPCAGPILGLVLTGAALNGASASTSLLLLAYAAGAATSLALALLLGGRVFAAMKRSLGAGEWVRRGLGVAVLVAIVAIVFGWDTGFLTRVSLASTTRLEQGLIDRVQPPTQRLSSGGEGNDLAVEGTLPSLDGAVAWLNSAPLTADSLRGKVVVVDFWTYSCINCLRALPYVNAWAEKYRDHGLVVIGVHSPEFAFERDVDNVSRAVRDLHVTYPVAVDSRLTIWRAFNNLFWPAHYFIDAQGRVRHHHFGEGEYAASERVIQRLLAEAGYHDVPGGVVNPAATGAQAAADAAAMRSPETYVGYARGRNFASGPVVQGAPSTYAVPASLERNQWGLAGVWTIDPQRATLGRAPGRIVFRFHARDLHLVLGPGPGGRPVRFRVTIDGAAPGDAHGMDTDARGVGTVTSERLYQLVRQKGDIEDHTFVIEFLDPGVQAYAFTFG